MPQSPPLPGGKGSIWVWLSSPWACSTGHRLSVFPRVEHVNTKQASMSGAQGRKPETRDLEMIAGRLLSPSPRAAEPSPHCCPNLPQKTFLSASDSDSFSASVTLRLQLALPFLPEDVSKKKKGKVRLLGHVSFFATLACRPLPSMGFSRQEYWSGSGEGSIQGSSHQQSWPSPA